MSFMKDQPLARYKITLGTDSEALADKSADFVTAIVVHRVGNGGRYFWRRASLKPFHTLRDRIIREVIISLEAAQKLLETLRTVAAKEQALVWDFEIHADIGENGPTKALINEVTGMIRAYNFEFQVKPASYAASHVADRHV